VFIIDEVHMLSKQAFNALLKTLEEPPSHVKFILATTEPEKVLPTILSRCQRYDFRNIPTREIAGHLKSICKTEKIEAEDDALLLVAKAGAGSMRDSLSLLDRLLSIGETKLTVELLEQLLGLPKSQLIFDLCAAIGQGNVQSVLSQADKIIADGLAVDTLIVSLIDHLRNLMLLRTCGPKSDLVEVPGLSLTELSKQAEMFDPAALSQDIVILEELRRHVRQSQAGRALLDATLVRMSLADQFSSLSDLAERASGGVSQKKKSELGQAAGELSTPNAQRPTFKEEARPIAVAPAAKSSFIAPLPRSVPVAEPIEEAASVSSEQNSEEDDDDLPAVGKVWDGPRPSLGALMAAQAAAIKAEKPHVEPVQSGELSERWKAVIVMLAPQGPALSGLLQNGQFVRIDDGIAVVRYSSKNETNVKLLERANKKDLVRDALSKVMDQPLGVRFEISDTAVAEMNTTPSAPPAAAVAPVQAAKRPMPAATTPPAPAENSNVIRLTDEKRTELYQSDPLIRAVVDQLGGSIIRLEE
jgi:DNA polymerase III gamma/tau subunit